MELLEDDCNLVAAVISHKKSGARNRANSDAAPVVGTITSLPFRLNPHEQMHGDAEPVKQLGQGESAPSRTPQSKSQDGTGESSTEQAHKEKKRGCMSECSGDFIFCRFFRRPPEGPT